MSDALKQIEEEHSTSEGSCVACFRHLYRKPCDALKLARALDAIALSDSWEGKKAAQVLNEVAGEKR